MQLSWAVSSNHQIKTKKLLKCFTLHAMNLKYMKVSLFEITYKEKNKTFKNKTFSRHSNLLRCTCIVLNAALRSSKTSNEMQPWSDARSKSFVILTSAVSVLWWGLKPDWNSSQRSFFFARMSTIEQRQFNSLHCFTKCSLTLMFIASHYYNTQVMLLASDFKTGSDP